MSALWQALEEIDSYFGPDADGDELADEPAREVQARRVYARVAIGSTPQRAGAKIPRRANPDALTDELTDVWLTDKAREALHPCPIRAHERQMALVAAGDVNALELAAACALWRSARAARAEVEAK
jgi:hypothetical protein